MAIYSYAKLKRRLQDAIPPSMKDLGDLVDTMEAKVNEAAATGGSAWESLGTFDESAIDLSSDGEYSGTHSITSDEDWVVSAIENGVSQILTVQSDGTSKIVPDFNFDSGLMWGVTLTNERAITLGAGIWKVVLFTTGGKAGISISQASAKPTASITISSISVASDNSYIDVTLSKGAFHYAADKSVGPVLLADLPVTFAQESTGNATGWTASSLKKNDNTTEGLASALTGGETVIRIFGSATGDPNGQETVTVAPAGATSIMDVDGYVMSASEEASDNLTQIYDGFANTHSMVVDAQEGIKVQDSRFWRVSAGVDQPWTMELVFKTPAVVDVGVLLSIFDVGTSFGGFYIGINSNARPYVLVVTTSGVNFINTGRDAGFGSLSANTWYHIVATYDGSESEAGLNLYIDNDLTNQVGTETGTFTGLPVAVGPVEMQVSRDSDTVLGDGKYNFVRFFTKELSAAEVETLFDPDSGGVGQYPIDISGISALYNNLLIELQFNNNANAAFGNDGATYGSPTFDTDLP